MKTPEDYDGASIPELTELLTSDDPAERADAACALGDRVRAGESATLEASVADAIAALLTDEVPMVQFESAIALAEVQDRRATALLLISMRYRRFRLDAIRALGTLGDPAAKEPLRGLMGRWLMPWADRLQAAAALCALDDAAGAEHLEAMLGSRKRAERAAAIHFIGESRHPRALDLLRGILIDRSDPMRDVAARALGFLDDPEAWSALERARENADGELRGDIEEALARLARQGGH